MASTDYRRNPLPRPAQTPIGWLALCILGFIFSPFVGFTVHGKVAEPGLLIGMWFAVIPLSGLAVIAIRHWRAWRQLPVHIKKEWTSGRIIPADGAPALSPPLRFSHDRYWIEILAEGLSFSRGCLLSMQGVSGIVAKAWIADSIGEMFIPWADIAEWGVETDSDGPDYHVVRLRSGGAFRVRRFEPDNTSECALLDAVRSVGKVPVRLCCDVDCK